MHLVYSSSAENGFQHIGGITTEACDYPCPSRDFRTEVSWEREISIHHSPHSPHENLDSVPVSSIDGTENSLGPVDGKRARETSFDNEMDVTNKSTEYVECLTDGMASAHRKMLEIADSRSSFQTFDQQDNSDPLKAGTKISCESLNENNGIDGKEGIMCNDVDDPALESDVEHAAKRLRLTPTFEGEPTKSLSNDLCL